MSIKHTNNFSTTLNGSITNVATSMTLTTVTGAPTIGSGVSCYFTITDNVNYEIVQCDTAPSGATYSSITRGAQGTTAQAWSSGATVAVFVTADCLDRKLDAPASIINYAIFAGPTAAGGKAQQIANSTPGYVLQYQGSSSLATWNNLNGLATVSVLGDGSILYSDGSTWNALSTSGSSTRYLSNTGTNNRPAWAQINLTNGVTGTLPIANGGTAVTSVTTSPTASSFAGWDANNNLSSNNFLTGRATTATSAATRTLTVSSAQYQTYTGSTTHTQVMPVVSTLSLGTIYVTTNQSSGAVTVQSSGANTIQAMATNTILILQSNATSGTGASVWDILAYLPAGSSITGSGSLVRATSPTVTGLIVDTITKSDTTKGILGTTAADNSTSGYVGEYLQNTASNVSISNSTNTNITSVSLTAGDWFVFGNCTYNPGSTTVVTEHAVCINTTSASFSGAYYTQNKATQATNSDGFGFGAPQIRVNVNTTTTVYLVGFALYSTSTLTVSGQIGAIRIR